MVGKNEENKNFYIHSVKSISITNIGSRKKNEDAFYESDTLFVVADGVGGNAYGEVASRLACVAFSEYFAENKTSVYDLVYLNNALKFATQKFQETIAKYPETKAMATTVVLLAFDGNGAIVAWLGDSRLYHIRGEKVLFVTEDHSLKNELAKQGQDVTNISRNMITKALSATADYPFSFARIAKDDLQPNDYFFLCTDGVLENVTDELLCRELATENTLDEKTQQLFALCEGKTKDNFTFITIQI